MTETIVYKVLTADQHEDFLAGRFIGAPVDLADGFIHLSCAAQVTETVDRHFAGQNGLQVVAIGCDALGDTLRWEPSRGGALFPHVYGPLPLSAMRAAMPLARDAAGQVLLPEA